MSLPRRLNSPADKKTVSSGSVHPDWRHAVKNPMIVSNGCDRAGVPFIENRAANPEIGKSGRSESRQWFCVGCKKGASGAHCSFAKC